ncbi:archaeosine tRNA-guanine transglycosylase [Thermococcus onnurineus NA1]|uniref:tRNA-guanine(15) transglycosylase n=1 Tax=Thermococcus onnurineus (strain NA1) TaxID=523850 RepID=ATGT_THEON|nr:tRNA guanosine(15) transglycosylase TgtA [Thermococcus onnurineus]B6YUR8.1 RecName: Full=tRNA-guanine(15) transglycosylase; AltName: Full=7-cyano-7-deazaguanine tRNA-ribosyltransferase; AltName: Full=Archaeal tRNA-guanine transglycosylase [Thermococcus onnurineus NA1]ACJ16104.1 archaeosine tRNA-guanine transglycosylase [Thermococcus onnurineus NA1]
MVEFKFEVKARDAAGRIGKLEVNGKKIETPAIMPVINPKQLTVTPKELKEMGFGIIITNSYIIYKTPELREKALEVGIHRLLDYDGIIEVDSGSFQLMRYGGVDVTNREIVEFQERIGVDIGTFLDIPTPPDAPREKAEEDLRITLERAKEAEEIKGIAMNAAVQGSTYPDLRTYAARKLSEMNFEIHPIGAVVPLMESYRYRDLVDVVIASKQGLRSDRPVHLFGAGHPMIFALAVAMGIDLFDSASYALYAKDDRYLTPEGTKHLSELEYFPCSCPVCSRYTPRELREMPKEERTRLLALHNLWVIREELNRVKQAIKEGELWRLVDERARSHPKLYAAYKRLLEYQDYLEKNEPITKASAFFKVSEESLKWPIVQRAKARAERVKAKFPETINHPIFGEIPKYLSLSYPFAQSEGEEDFTIEKPGKREVRNYVMAVAEYQFGEGTREAFKDAFVELSRKTGMPRQIKAKGKHLATFRAEDGLLTLGIEGAKRLHEILPFPRMRVVVDEDAEPFARKGKNVFAKFVIDADENIRPYDEVLIVNRNDELLATGQTLLNGRELKLFQSGLAVKVRRGVEK